MIIFESSQGVIAVKPARVPEKDLGLYGSEGFLTWLRRHGGGSDPKVPCHSFGLGANCGYLLDRTDSGNAALEGLHCRRLDDGAWEISHPWMSAPVRWETSPFQDGANALATNARIVDPAEPWVGSDWTLYQLGADGLLQSAKRPDERTVSALATWFRELGGEGTLFWKCHDRHLQGKGKSHLSPVWLAGPEDRKQGEILEWGTRYHLDFTEGYSVGLFLDQRENRWRILENQIAAGFEVFPDSGPEPPRVLNTFAYTCGFSVCAARAGASVVSVDLSKKYLEWGKRNFLLNGLDPDQHEFLYGDVFGWVKRFVRREQRFDLVILDPPTFSRSKEWGVFKVSRDLAGLVERVVPLLRDGGRLLVSCNPAYWHPEAFTHAVETAVGRAGRRVGRRAYSTQPWDFGLVSGGEAYLKVWWLEVLDRV